MIWYSALYPTKMPLRSVALATPPSDAGSPRNPLTIGGLGIGTIGLADVQLVGTATNLRGRCYDPRAINIHRCSHMEDSGSLHFAYCRCRRRTTPDTPAQGLIRRRLRTGVANRPEVEQRRKQLDDLRDRRHPGWHL